MTDAISQDGVFRFFDLPLEMRNLVYDALTPEGCMALPLRHHKDRIQIYVENPPPFIPILLANRQLNAEFNKQWFHTHGKDVSLHAIDLGPRTRHADNRFLWQSELPRRSVQAVSECMIDAHLYWGDWECSYHEAMYSVEYPSYGAADICSAVAMLKRLVESMETSFLPQLPSLEHVDFKIGMWWPCEDGALEWPDTPHGPELKTWLERLVSHPKCRSCEVLQVDGNEDHYLPVLVDSYRGYATWNRERGWKAAPDTRRRFNWLDWL